MTDPEHGGDEIPPMPSADAPGTEYLVGVERETWRRVDGWWTQAADGRLLGLTEATREMHRRGARTMRLVRCWGLPTLERADERSPLLERQTP